MERIIYLYETDSVTQNRKPVAAVAYVVEGVQHVSNMSDGVPVFAHKVRYAIARCHPNDAFVKKVGRAKATGRLKSSRCSDITAIYTNQNFFTSTSGFDWQRFHGELLKEVEFKIAVASRGAA